MAPAIAAWATRMGWLRLHQPTLSHISDISYMCDTKQTGLPVIVYILMVCTFGGVFNMAEHYSIFNLGSTPGPIAEREFATGFDSATPTNPSPSLPVHATVVCNLIP